MQHLANTLGTNIMSITRYLAAGVALAVACASAANATDFPVGGSTHFFISSGTPFTPSITALFNNSYDATTASFTDRFLFTIPQNGSASGSISTSFSSTANMLVIDKLLINGVEYPVPGSGSGQSTTVGGIAILKNIQNVIEVQGHTVGAGGYSGTATFTAGAVPEPATWGMIVVGFGAMGAAMRRRQRTNVTFA
jgi:hypothetical protein